MGNVVAACVLLDPNNPIEGLNDSKQLSEKKRDALEPLIKEKALAYGIGQCTPQEIDTMNILNAFLRISATNSPAEWLLPTTMI